MSPSSLDLPPQLFQEFLALAEARDLDRAARQLRVSPDTLTKSMRRLERQLGTRLFVPDERAFRLTPDGDALTEPAQRAVSAATQFMASVRSAGHTLRVAHSSSVDTLAAVLDRFAERHPDVAIDERVLPCDAQLRALGEREIDVALCRVAGAAPADCHVELVRLDPIVAAVASQSGVAPLSLDPGRTAACVGDTNGEWSARDELIASYERAAGCELRRVRVVVGAGQEMAALERTRAPAFLTLSSSRAPTDRRLVGLVPLQPYFPWSVVWPVDPSPTVAAFVETARAVAEESGWLAVDKLPGDAWLPQDDSHATRLPAGASHDVDLQTNVSEFRHRPPTTAAGLDCPQR
jgi:DNA-binding transcriptional LysR family regulator